jgi:hypothetical protein
MSTESSPDPTLVLKNQCLGTLYEFLDASVEVWPECQALKKYHALFKEAKETSFEAFTTAVYSAIQSNEKLFERMQNKDLSVFQEPLEIFKELDIYTKLSEAPQEVQDTCWTYIAQIVQTANLSRVYGSAPPDMLQKVSAVAESFMKKMEDGTFDPKELDPMALTQMMMEGVDKKEMEQWASTVMNPQSINSLMSVMQNVMGNLGDDGKKVDFANLAMSMAGSMGAGSMGGGGANPLAALAGMNPEIIQQMMGGLMKNMKK